MHQHWFLGPRGEAGAERPMISIHTHTHTDEFYHRDFVRFALGFCVRRVTEFQEDGVTPAELKITYRDDVYLRPVFEPGSTRFEGKNPQGNPVSVQMLDEAGAPVAQNPAYYELTRSKGDMIRLSARAEKNQPFGAVVSWTPADGPSQTLEALGIALLTDAHGILEQVLTPTHLAFLEDVGVESYRVTVYELPEGYVPDLLDGRYVPPEGEKPSRTALVENPEPGQQTELRISSLLKNGNREFYRWTVNPLGDYDLDRCDENWEVLYPRTRRWYSEDRSQFFRIRGRTICGGVIRVTTDRREQVAGRWRLTERSVKTGDTVRTTTYIHHEHSGPLRGKLRYTKHCDGNWVAYVYAEDGRKTMEIRPGMTQRQVVEYVPDPNAVSAVEDDLLRGMLDSFTDGAPPGKRRISRRVTEYHPPVPPEHPEDLVDSPDVDIKRFD